MSNHDDGCATAIATLIVGFLVHCLLGAVIQWLLVEWFSYHVGYWIVVGSVWLFGFCVRLLK